MATSRQSCLTPSTHQSPMNGASFGQLCQVNHLDLEDVEDLDDHDDYFGGISSKHIMIKLTLTIVIMTMMTGSREEERYIGAA